MTDLVLPVLGAVARRFKADFIRNTHHVDAVQEQFLRSLLRTHQHTAFGREYKFSDLRSVDQFRERVPVQPYSAFAPYTERMANGEPNVLVSDPLIYFNISSGSTGQNKLIPVTKRSRRMLLRANRAAMGFVTEAGLRNQRPPGKMLLTLSVNAHGHTPTGIAYAPVSTSDLRLTDLLSRQVFSCPFEAFQIADTATRYYICLLFALRNPDLRVIGATFPVLALQLCNYLETNAESLIHALKTGKLPSWLKLSPELRVKFDRQWSAYTERAQQLQRILDTHGRLTPQAAWADLSFMVTARGGTSNFYFERFPEYFGGLPIFGGTYSCAEGVLGVHRDFNTDSVLPALESAFIEFIPEDQWDQEYPKTLLPQEVQPGKCYRVVFTNYSGFYRYDLGDIVEIEGFLGQAPLMIFRHRRGGFISSSTEKTSETHAIEVMKRLQQSFEVALENFCITLSDDAIPAHYLVNIELAAGSTLANPEQFLQAFDDTMKEVQKFYAIKRRDQIPLPRLRILAPGSFETLRQQMVGRGVAEAQLKFPHVSEDRRWLDGLTVMQEVRLRGDRFSIAAGRLPGAGRNNP
ncbi:GH3 auxin-responsive promoter [filamentous cyanobacterium CCP1]|nr:GH3 auxin-responsive promoter [filamentous cyanobacterium CCP2]PSB56164.1 GH3 auxin-responsive promoter [filamentous cyanobacterium CCP1]